jgi:hypothetical protein
MDGKHVQIRKPAESGSYYFNYKNTFRIILMAVVNDNYMFMIVDVGKNVAAVMEEYSLTPLFIIY